MLAPAAAWRDRTATQHRASVRMAFKSLMTAAAEGVRREDTTALRVTVRRQLDVLPKAERHELVGTLALVTVALAAELTDQQRAALTAGAAPTPVNAYIRSVLLALELDATRHDHRE